MTIKVAQADDAASPDTSHGAAISAPGAGDAPAGAHTVEIPILPHSGGVNVPIQGGEESLFPPFDFSAFPSHFFWLVISFGLLYFFVNRLIVPHVGGIIEDRRDRVASDHGEASRLARETDEVIAVYEKELADARHKAFAIAQERRDELKAEQERQQAETEDALNKKIAEAEDEIVRRRDAALADVDAIAVEAAMAIVGEIAANLKVSDTEVKQAVDRIGGAHASV